MPSDDRLTKCSPEEVERLVAEGARRRAAELAMIRSWARRLPRAGWVSPPAQLAPSLNDLAARYTPGQP